MARSRDGAGPSHERQAQLLASIDDAAGALQPQPHVRADGQLVAQTMEAPATLSELEHPSAMPKAA